MTTTMTTEQRIRAVAERLYVLGHEQDCIGHMQMAGTLWELSETLTQAGIDLAQEREGVAQ